jgi:hypothetical protein
MILQILFAVLSGTVTILSPRGRFLRTDHGRDTVRYRLAGFIPGESGAVPEGMKPTIDLGLSTIEDYSDHGRWTIDHGLWCFFSKCRCI